MTVRPSHSTFYEGMTVSPCRSRSTFIKGMTVGRGYDIFHKGMTVRSIHSTFS